MSALLPPLLPLPEPDGYCAMNENGSFIIAECDFAKHNAYRIYTAAQLKAYATAHGEAVAAALAPKWLPIETAPKDGQALYLHARGKVYRASWLVIPYRESRTEEGHYIDHQDYDEYWMDHADGDAIEDPTEWMPDILPTPPKGETP